MVGHLGFEFVHKQMPFEGCEYHVDNLATGFRNGIRLLRLVSDTRQLKLKYPYPSKAQKLHNVRVLLDTLRAVGYSMIYSGR